jgi:hypothetical protein
MRAYIFTTLDPETLSQDTETFREVLGVGVFSFHTVSTASAYGYQQLDH